MPYAFLVSLLSLFLSLAPTSGVCMPAITSEEDAAIVLLEEVATRSRSIRTLHTTFIQEKNSPMLTAPLLAKGIMCMVRQPRATDQPPEPHPDLLWVYVSPRAPGFMSHHGEKWIVQPDGRLRSLERGEAMVTSAIANMLALWLDPDVRRIRSQFEVTKPFTNKPMLNLRPLQRQFFSRMEVSFEPDNGSLTDILFEEHNGSTLRLIFTGTTVNQALPGTCQPLNR